MRMYSDFCSDRVTYDMCCQKDSNATTFTTFNAAPILNVHNQVPEQSCGRTSESSNQDTSAIRGLVETIANDDHKSTALFLSRSEVDTIVPSGIAADEEFSKSMPDTRLFELVDFDICYQVIELPTATHHEPMQSGESTELTTLSTEFGDEPATWEDPVVTPCCTPNVDFYYQVLSRMLYNDIVLFQQVLASQLFCFIPLNITALAGLYSLQVEDIRNAVQGASSLILFPQSNEEPPKFVNCDVPEFFLDKSRSKDYHVDPMRGHGLILDACTRLMIRASKNEDVADSSYTYACRYWLEHWAAVRRRRGRAKL
jgi:hypothetical protein